MRTFLVMFVCTSCAGWRSEAMPPGEPVEDPCGPVAQHEDPGLCYASTALDAAERDMNGPDAAAKIREASAAIASVRDPGTRLLMRLQLAHLEARLGMAYSVTIAEARADAEAMQQPRDRKAALAFVHRTEMTCAEQAAEYHLRTPM